MLDTLKHLEAIPFPTIRRGQTETLQLNLGYVCNQQCVHCHVNAGPNRTETMTDDTLEAVKQFVQDTGVRTLDLTGGAPELHPKFRDLVAWAHAHGIRVIDRCNLTILFEPGQEDLVDFLKAHQVSVVASMPCYLKENVDKQRGKGTFDKSIEALQVLNQAGYGVDGTGLEMNLVYNPQGANLPPPQATLEQDYKKHLAETYGIQFNTLLVITNLPIARFGSMLLSKGQFDDYMVLLQEAHLDANLAQVMCRSLLSIDWQGNVYDCDFNQMLHLPSLTSSGESVTIFDLNKNTMPGDEIVVRGHCFGCTAGQGSSCSGALS